MQAKSKVYETIYKVTKKLHSWRLILQKTKHKDSQLNMT